MLLNFTLLLSNSFASVQDEVMVKSKTKSNVQKKVFRAEFHRLSHLEGCCFICLLNILNLKGLLFLVTL